MLTPPPPQGRMVSILQAVSCSPASRARRTLVPEHRVPVCPCWVCWSLAWTRPRPPTGLCPLPMVLTAPLPLPGAPLPPAEHELWPQNGALASGLTAPPGRPRPADTWGGQLASSNSGQLWAGPRGRCVPRKLARWGPREGLAAPSVSGACGARPSPPSRKHGSRVSLMGCLELGTAPQE